MANDGGSSNNEHGYGTWFNLKDWVVNVSNIAYRTWGSEGENLANANPELGAEIAGALARVQAMHLRYFSSTESAPPTSTPSRSNLEQRRERLTRLAMAITPSL